MLVEGLRSHVLRMTYQEGGHCWNKRMRGVGAVTVARRMLYGARRAPRALYESRKECTV